MILVAGGGKGGSGKSTIAINLAIMRAKAHHDVLLVDADDQETAADFTALRNATLEGGAGYTCIKLTGPAVHTEVVQLAPKYDDIVIDAGGRDTVSQCTPTRSSPSPPGSPRCHTTSRRRQRALYSGAAKVRISRSRACTRTAFSAKRLIAVK